MNDYYLDCGCWSGWADHRCMGGSRPSYCRCGAPDDCYCPSPSEMLELHLADTAMPARLVIDKYDGTMTGIRLSTTTWIAYNTNQLIDLLMDSDAETDDCVIFDARNERIKL